MADAELTHRYPEGGGSVRIVLRSEFESTDILDMLATRIMGMYREVVAINQDEGVAPEVEPEAEPT